jgi:hypothetical protein
MKVRWTDQSVRFRITPTELATLGRGEPIHTSLELPGGGWSATVQPDPNGETRLVGVRVGTVALYLSPSDVARLADPAEEGVYFHEPLVGDPKGLRYYIEKDFPCAHPRPIEAAEQTETFAPPPGFAERESHSEACA